MPVTKAKKSEILKSLDTKFGKAKAVYFADYRGLTVKKVTELRKKLKTDGIDYVVSKKTLYQIALKNNHLPEAPKNVLEGPVGAAFGYGDVVAPVKALYEFSKTSEDTFKILGGLVDGRFITKAEALQLATLPSKEQLLGQLVGTMKAPISGFHGALAGVLRKFVYALNAVKDKKGATA